MALASVARVMKGPWPAQISRPASWRSLAWGGVMCGSCQTHGNVTATTRPQASPTVPHVLVE